MSVDTMPVYVVVVQGLEVLRTPDKALALRELKIAQEFGLNCKMFLDSGKA